MKTLEIDLETRSDRDITKCGVYAYADSPYFAITLMSVAIDDGAVQLYDLANGDRVPEDILTALTDESVIKRAFNVQFERVCLSRYLHEEYPQIFRSYSIDADTVGDYLSPVGWQCTMIHCRTLGLPSTLAAAGAALKLEQQKMPEGKALIKYFVFPMIPLTAFHSFIHPPMHLRNGKPLRLTTSRMWRRSLPLTSAFPVSPYRISSGSSFISIRRSTIAASVSIWNWSRLR